MTQPQSTGTREFRLISTPIAKDFDFTKDRARSVLSLTVNDAISKKDTEKGHVGGDGRSAVAKPKLALLEIPRIPDGKSVSMSSGDAGLKKDVRQTIQTTSPESGFTTTPDEEDTPVNNGVSNVKMEYGINGDVSAKLELHRPTSRLSVPTTTQRMSSTMKPTQFELVHDILSVIYGHDGAYVRLTENGAELYPNVEIPSHYKEATLKCCYAGFLCRSLELFARVRESDAPSGVSGQKIGIMVWEEVLAYRRRITTLCEKQHHKDLQPTNFARNQSTSITLMRLSSFLSPELWKLHVLLNIATDAANYRGGELLDFLKNQLVRTFRSDEMSI